MRILTREEFGSLNAKTPIPVDLEQQYFPVQFRAYSYKDGERVAEGWSAVETKHLKDIMERVGFLVDAKWVRVKDRVTKDGYTFDKEVYTELNWDTFEFGAGSKRNTACTLVQMFPLSHLVHSRQLQSHEVEQRPGYIYFAAVAPKTNDWGELNLRGSNIYKHESFQTWRHKMRLAEENDAERLERLTQQRQREREQEKPKRQSRKKKEVVEEEPIEFEREVDKIPPWKGEIEDLAHCTNSRVVKSLALEEGVHYILESPLEFPRGFVRETAMVLKRDWHATSKLVEDFCNLCFSKPAALPDTDIEHDAVFPQGENALSGPDIWWRYSENPWLVQTILLARLIGGDFWQYALSNLEESSPELIDYAL